MTTPFDQRLQQMGLLSASQASQSQSEGEAEAQLACARHRQSLVARMRPHWGAFLDTWNSASMHQAARQATPAQRKEIARAWAENTDLDFIQAVKELSGKDITALLTPWVNAAVTRRHQRLPLAPGAMLEEWCAAIDPKDSEDEKAFWGHLSQHVRAQESQADRTRAQTRVAPVAQALLGEVHRRIAEQKKGLGVLKSWRRRPAMWLQELLTQPTFVRSCAALIIENTRDWTGQLKGDQAFPALAVGLETSLTRKLGARTDREVDLLERWLALSIEQALPHVLAEPLATPQVARLVRESLHQDAHAQSLAPAPLLRPSSR